MCWLMILRESWHGFGISGTDSKLGWSPSVKDRSPAQDWWLASIGLVAHKPSNVCVSTGTCPIGMCSGRAYTIPVGWCVCANCALVHG